jgi:hypothetical protein
MGTAIFVIVASSPRSIIARMTRAWRDDMTCGLTQTCWSDVPFGRVEGPDFLSGGSCDAAGDNIAF